MTGAVFDSLLPIAAIGVLAGLIWGVATSGQRFSDSYLDRELAMQTASPARRLGAHLLELTIWAFTFGIGWLIWFAVVAPRGQTPGKAIVSTYVMREGGDRAGGWYMWGRELLAKWVLFYFLAVFTGGLVLVVGAFWCLLSRDKQCLWDKIMSSYVAYSADGPPEEQLPQAIEAMSPAGRLRQLQELRTDGIITAEEYEERRARLVEHL